MATKRIEVPAAAFETADAPGFWRPELWTPQTARPTAHKLITIGRLFGRGIDTTRQALEWLEAGLRENLDNRREELDRLIRTGLIPIAGGSEISDFLEIEIIDHVFRNAAIYAVPANVYVALHTATLTDTMAQAEVSGGSYAREAVATATGWSGAANATDNVAAVTFTTASASWGTVSDVGLWDASGAGNGLMWSAVDTSKTVGSGDTAEFAIGALDASVD